MQLVKVSANEFTNKARTADNTNANKAQDIGSRIKHQQGVTNAVALIKQVLNSASQLPERRSLFADTNKAEG